MGGADSRLASLRLQRPQPSPSQNEAGGRAGGKPILRPILALERLTLLETEDKVVYRHGENGVDGKRWTIWSSSPEWWFLAVLCSSRFRGHGLMLNSPS